MIFLSLYFKFISNEWQYFFYIPIALCSILLLLMTMAPESPVYLYEKGNFSRAHNVINMISKINKGSIHHEKWMFYGENNEDFGMVMAYF